MSGSRTVRRELDRRNGGIPVATKKSEMFQTLNDLDPRVRERMVASLNAQLADTFDLASQVKQAHWNLKGPQFMQLPELFDALYERLVEHVDLIAERAAALGGKVTGTARMAAANSRLEEMPGDIVLGLDFVQALAQRYGSLGASTRAAIDEAAKVNDADTADIFTEVSRALDKDLWFLEAHLQA
ncbi:MAG: DNA starvation/stationary phase protection protein Dps [Thermomicrobiales bacterium]